MTTLDLIIIAAYLLINLFSFALMGADKAKAKRGARRIPERTLLGVCAVFGALGGYFGMQMFRHKTQHKKFTITVPILMLFQLALLALYFARVAG